MTIQDAYNWIIENAKDWKITEQSDKKLVISKNNVFITITNNEINWKTANYSNYNPIDLYEEALKILTSRDWVEQTYCKGFRYKTFVDNPNQNVWKDDFARYLEQEEDEFDFIRSIRLVAATDANYGNGTIYAETVCSLDKETLNSLNEFIEVQIYDGIGENYNVMRLISEGHFYKSK